MKKNALEILFFIVLIAIGYYIWTTILRLLTLGLVMLVAFGM